MAKNKTIKNSQNKGPSDLIVFSGILILTLMVFQYCFKAMLTNWDDGSYVTDNILIRSLSLKNIFTEFVVGNYHPLTMLSYALEYKFFKLNPVVFHTTNILLHAVNSFLVYIVIKKITQQYFLALFVCAFFCVHPFHVENVAWVSDRKDLLASLFFLLGMNAYLKYVFTKISKHYIFTLLFYLLALLSKATVVVFPVILILLDFLLAEKVENNKWINKIPFFILSIVFGLLAIKAQSSTPAMGLRVDYNFIERIYLGSYSLVLYLINAIIPFKLSAYHPYPLKADGSFPLYVYLSVVVVIGLSGMLVYYFIKKRKEELIWMLFFLFTIVLLLQFIPVGFALIAERYTYIPYIGLFVLIGIYWQKLANKSKLYFKVIPILYVSILSWVSFNYCKVWQNSLTLWTDVIDKYDYAELAYLNRGIIYAGAGQIKTAYDDFEKAIAIHPNYLQALNNRGLAKSDLGDTKGSIVDFTKALAVDSTYHESLNNRGLSYFTLNEYDKALVDVNKAIKYKSDFALAYYNRGNIYAAQNKKEDAVINLKTSAELFAKQNNSQLASRVLNRLKEVENSK